jgi:hypothetical protein
VSVRRLAGLQKGFDELALTADDAVGESLEPLACWNIRFSVEPVLKHDDLFVGNVPLTHSRQKMSE